jgi:hypothetical protein
MAKQTERDKLRKIVVGGLRETIRVHGIINKRLIGSAAKRIVGDLLNREKRIGRTHADHDKQPHED